MSEKMVKYIHPSKPFTSYINRWNFIKRAIWRQRGWVNVTNTTRRQDSTKFTGRAN